jgi:hypothetical protein
MRSGYRGVSVLVEANIDRIQTVAVVLAMMTFAAWLHGWIMTL